MPRFFWNDDEPRFLLQSLGVHIVSIGGTGLGLHADEGSVRRGEYDDMIEVIASCYLYRVRFRYKAASDGAVGEEHGIDIHS